MQILRVAYVTYLRIQRLRNPVNTLIHLSHFLSTVSTLAKIYHIYDWFQQPWQSLGIDIIHSLAILISHRPDSSTFSLCPSWHLYTHLATAPFVEVHALIADSDATKPLSGPPATSSRPGRPHLRGDQIHKWTVLPVAGFEILHTSHSRTHVLETWRVCLFRRFE